MLALAWTYFPPTCARTDAYSFSAPTATILPPPDPDEPAASEDEQPLARSATPRASGPPAAQPLQSLRITPTPGVRWSRFLGNDNDSQSRLQHGRRDRGSLHPPGGV